MATGKNEVVGMHLKYCNMSATDLAIYDDAANSLTVDPYLGFTTHKMNLKYVFDRIKVRIRTPHYYL